MEPPQESPELELRDYLRVLRARRGVIALAMLMVTAASLGASLLQTPVYQAKAQLLLRARSTESLFDPETGQRNDAVGAVETEMELLTSQPVVEEVRRRIGTAPKVSVTQVGQTDVVEVKARSTDPKRAAAVANAYANSFIDFRRNQAVNDLLSAGEEIQRKVVQLQKEIDALGSPPSAAPGRPLGSDAQGERRDTLVQQQALFKQRLDQLQVDAALKTGGAQLVTAATEPTSPIKPTPVKSAVLAGAVGLIFGVGLAFLFEYLDDSIKGKEELERAAHGLPTLGLIPVVPGWKEKKKPIVVSLADPKSPAAEAYRSLRTSVQFMGLDHPLRTILVTSAGAGEGKTTTLSNLGVALAQAGQRVVIVSCDLRRPRVHAFFGLSNDIGFTSVLLGQVPVSGAIQRVEEEDRLLVLPSGPVPPNPAELLAGRRAAEVLAALQGEADVVLIDSPPVLPVTDATVLSSRADGVLLVATAAITTRREFHRAHEVLRQVDASIVGTVLNRVSGEGAYGYAYGYQYAYATPQTNGRRGRAAASRR